ncbi:MAG: TerC family protein [Bacteroidota bacterium]|jgi:tellurite resistance protein TerC
MHTILLWVGFNIFIIVLLTLDLKVFNRKPHEISIKESLMWSGVWIAISLLFNIGVYFWFGRESALQFFTGYLIEKSLSIDNLFVFLLLFSYFKVPAKYQHEVLFWGILGALLMRGALILLGAALITRFHWILYILGLFLVVTGVKMAFQDGKKEVHPERNIVVRFFKKFLPVTSGYHEEKFFVKTSGKRYGTLLLIVLIVIETTDLLFAVDSIPAIFAITQDSFIIYTSNVFAILGLRSLYFALAGIMDLFYYLRHGLSVVLTFIGLKMLLMGYVNIPIGLALGVVGTVLLIAIAASVIRARIQKNNL